VPAASQFQSDGEGTGGYMTGSTRTPGASFVSLRGLGTNRNLVLLDGRRAMPVNATMAVNINNIPSAALERVETITGGASSVYGADAIAGVVNFVLKRDFEGFDIDMQYGQSAEGDADEQRISALMGANFADNRGNIMIGFEYAKRGALINNDRAFYRESFADPTVDGADFITTGGIRILPGNAPDQAVVDAIFDQSAAGSVNSGGYFYMNDDGSVFKRDPAGSYRYSGPLVDSDGIQWRKYDDDGQLDQNRPNVILQLPLDRYSVFARGIMEVADNMRVFGQMMFTDTTSEAAGPFTAHIGGWGAAVPHGSDLYAPSIDTMGNTRPAYMAGGPYGLNCPAVGGCTESQAFPKPPEINALLDSRPDPDAEAEIWHVPNYLGNKVLTNDISSYQFLAGVEGELSGTDMTWEFYVSHGETHTQAETAGTSRLDGFRWLVNQPNYSRGLQYTGNNEYPYSGFGAGTVYCETGYPIFYGDQNGWGSATPIIAPTQNVPSQDCIDTLLARVKDNSTMVQDIAEFNLQGAAFDMPAGEARFAAGVSYRNNDYRYVPDPLQSYAAILDSAAGIYPVEASFGKVSATDIYGELLLPLYSRGSQALNLELGYRKSDNDPTETVDTHKALLDWRFTDRVRFRGGIQKANRAPNVAELFQSSEQQFYYTSNGDWCSTRNPNPRGANPAVNPMYAAGIESICRSLMGTAGAQVYYGDIANQSNSATSARWLNVIGNPDLHSEEADTTTAGIVVDVGDSVTLSLDYWAIDIADMVSFQSVESLWEECLGPDTNPSFDPTHAACLQLGPARNPTDGSQAPYFVTYTNAGAIDTAGWDMQLDWAGNLGPGNLSVNFLATISDHVETRSTPEDEWTDWKGTDGPSELSGVQSYSYDYRTFTTLSYGQGAWNASLRWRHLPSITSEAHLFNPNATQVPTDSYDMFDFSGRYAMGRFDLRFGIDNLLDQDPEITFADDTTSGLGSTNANFYDIIGRRYYFGVHMGF
jgi:outer membrane receptor protein involved in Fe transport